MDVSGFDEWRLAEHFGGLGQRIRRGELDLGRHHTVMGLAHGVRQAMHCGYGRISAVEVGVAHGGGLLDLCEAAHFFREEYGIEVTVWGIDNATGLPLVQASATTRKSGAAASSPRAGPSRPHGRRRAASPLRDPRL